MNILDGIAKTEAEKYLELATREARKSSCTRAQCGGVLVNGGKIIGRGYNSPPLNDENNRMCENEYTYSNGEKLKYDTTCCIHAEWRVLIDAVKRNPKLVKGSTLYFMRIEEGEPIPTQPFCTVCSRLLLGNGVKDVVLWQDEGLVLYDTKNYNQANYSFFL